MRISVFLSFFLVCFVQTSLLQPQALAMNDNDPNRDYPNRDYPNGDNNNGDEKIDNFQKPDQVWVFHYGTYINQIGMLLKKILEHDFNNEEPLKIAPNQNISNANNYFFSEFNENHPEYSKYNDFFKYLRSNVVNKTSLNQKTAQEILNTLKNTYSDKLNFTINNQPLITLLEKALAKLDNSMANDTQPKTKEKKKHNKKTEKKSSVLKNVTKATIVAIVLVISVATTYHFAPWVIIKILDYLPENLSSYIKYLLETLNNNVGLMVQKLWDIVKNWNSKNVQQAVDVNQVMQEAQKVPATSWWQFWGKNEVMQEAQKVPWWQFWGKKNAS